MTHRADDLPRATDEDRSGADGRAGDPIHLHPWWGRMLDADSHILLPAGTYRDLLGDEIGGPMEAWAAKYLRTEHAEAPPTHEDPHVAVWQRANWRSIGAEDIATRVEALDLMGVARQLVLPPVCWPALHANDPGAASLLSRYNDWLLDWAGPNRDRVRPVALLPARDVDETVTEAERVLAAGAGAVEWQFAHPPADLSPADPAWDPLWAVLAESGRPLVLHVGGGGIGDMGGPGRSMIDLRWGRTRRLRPPLDDGSTHPYGAPERGNVGPFDIVLQHVPAEVFLTALVLGGVFDRHPGLAVVVLELGAQWVGGWVERLDAAWEGSVGIMRWNRIDAERRPSETVRSHLRVAPSHGESVGRLIDRSGLDEVFVFTTDHPHAEGGSDAVHWYERTLRDHGDDVAERFFVENSRILFPT